MLFDSSYKTVYVILAVKPDKERILIDFLIRLRQENLLRLVTLTSEKYLQYLHLIVKY